MSDSCTWTPEDDPMESGDLYVTSCSQMVMFNDGGPSENRFQYCPYCGCKIEVEEYADA